MTEQQNEYQDQGSLEQPQAATEGPVNPVADKTADVDGDQEHLNPQTLEADPTNEPSQDGLSALEQVNEAREAGAPLTGAPTVPPGDHQSSTPGGTGVSGGGVAGGGVDTGSTTGGAA